jgi:hypothetical protein
MLVILEVVLPLPAAIFIPAVRPKFKSADQPGDDRRRLSDPCSTFLPVNIRARAAGRAEEFS